MLVEVGHAHAVDGNVVTQTRLSDDINEAGDFLVSYKCGTDAQEVKNHLFDNPGLVTHMGGNTAVLEAVNPIRDRLNGTTVNWVSVTAEGRDPAVAADFERFLAEFWACPAGKPEDVEETHWTLHGSEAFAPGTKPEGE